ncbi:MAG: helix-turn-helix domain-containing protein [candidate division KSB1 bacterium]|nr:helix-turn-helix domain-containing protein [candidate division KSB1 bacterium]
MDGDNVRLILGFKVKQYRLKQGLSLKQLAARTGLSISFLSEIEKGKKYPKPEKIVLLARALGISFDELVSMKMGEELDSLNAVLNSSLLKEFPFHFFGIAPGDFLDLITSSPQKAGAFIRTILEIGKAYDMHVEHFYFATLRSYQKLHNNYFEEIEVAAERFVREQKWDMNPPIKKERFQKILEADYGYVIDEQTLNQYPELQKFRSVWVDSKPPRLLVNEKLLASQKAFILGREIGYNYLGLKERAITSSWLKVRSFEQVLDNFKASYFAGALMINRDLLYEDISKFFQNQSWDGEAFLAMMRRYDATPEMFLYRLSQIIPRFFGLKEIFYLRFNNAAGSQKYRLTKELNMSRVNVPYGIGLNEHYCRRWLSISLLNRLAEQQKQRNAKFTIIAAQRSKFIESDAEFFTITLARPLALIEGTNSSMSIGFLMNDDFKQRVRFWNDPKVPTVRVNETCERCGLNRSECSERVAPPEIYQQVQTQKVREKVLEEMLKNFDAIP